MTIDRDQLSGPGIAPVYRNDPRLEGLIGPGGPFEVEEIVLDGVPLRTFVNLPSSIIDCFRLSENHEDRDHIVFEGERWTFGRMRAQALSLARELSDSFSVRSGDHVVLAMRNFPEFVVGFWGAVIVGAVVVPLNAWWTGPELVYGLNDSEAPVAIVDQERLESIRGCDAGLTHDPVLMVVRSDRPERLDGVAIESFTGGEPLSPDRYAQREPDDVATILYTSGTTGRPKGALNTHRSTLANLMNMAFMTAREALLSGRPPAPARQSASIAAAPLFHIGGMAAIVGGAMGGSKIVLMRRWTLDEGLALAKAEQVTNLGGVPTMARQILDDPSLTELGLDVRTFSMGGAAVPPDLPLAVLKRFGDGVQIFNGYGLTETTSAVVSNVGTEYADHPQSVGRPNLTADIRVEDLDGRVLDVGQIGELCFRSPQVARGYWHRPDDTAACFVEGWFHTGDLGYVDADGFVYVVDRLKDVVIRGGENVYCAEVEAVLHEHPAVEGVAVVGLTEKVMGERVCAVVIVRPDHSIDLRSLRDFATDLALFKRPEALCLTRELPLTATGKVAKTELRQYLAERPEAIEKGW